MKKLDPKTKYKLIYSGELAIFSVVFLVFAILKFTGVMGYNSTRRLIFNFVTLAGASWGIADFVWAIASKKRRERVCLLDKILVLPLVAFIITFDIISLVVNPADPKFYLIMMGAAFSYVAGIYAFEAVYHFYRPIPGLFDDLEEEENDEKSPENPKN